MPPVIVRLTVPARTQPTAPASKNAALGFKTLTRISGSLDSNALPTVGWRVKSAGAPIAPRPEGEWFTSDYAWDEKFPVPSSTITLEAYNVSSRWPYTVSLIVEGE